MIDVAIIIVSWNVRDYLVQCLRSVFADLQRSSLRGEVWVVDNASTDGTAELVRSLFSNVHLIANETNHGFGAANNQGMAAAKEAAPRYYFLLNPDTKLQSGALFELINALEEHPDGGMAGARLVYGNGRFQHSAFYFPGLRQLAFDLFPLPARLYESRWNGRYPRAWQAKGSPPFAIDHPLGASMMVRADVAESTHGFDESFHMYCEEIDWSWRIQAAGWRIYAVPAAEIVHYGGESTRQVPAQSVINLWQSRAQLYEEMYGRFKLTIASKMVQIAMRRRAKKTTDPHMQQAYKTIIQIWQDV